ncbi:MAG TPA: sensor histidine kinase [bacterium]|nr:sensor histidine kinase [bacterium]
MPTVSIETLDWLALGVGAHAAVMLLLFLRFLETRERIVLWWTGAYVLFTLHVVAEAAALRTADPWLFFARHAAFVAASLVMLSSVAAAWRNLSRRHLLAGATVLAACALAASALGARAGTWWLMVWPPSVVAAAAFLASAYFLRQTEGRTRQWGTALLFWGLVLTGLHGLDYPLLRPVAPLPGALASGVFTLLFGTGIVLRANQRVRELTVLNAVRGTLLAKVFTTQEDERRWICRMLHEEVGQMLSALIMSLDGTERCFAEVPSAATRQIAHIRSVAEKTLDEIRTIVDDLRPTLLDELGLRAAVCAHARRVLAPAGASVEIETDGLTTRFPPRIEVVLFRILQESLTDIAKHAGATRVGVRIARADTTVYATVTDNGARFDPAVSLRAGDGRTIGLFAMRERAAAIGGQVSTCTLPGAGTQIEITLPYGGEPVEQGLQPLLSPAGL